VDIDAAFVDKLVNLSQKEMGETECGKPYKISSICINTNRKNTNVILGREIRCLYGQPFIFDEIRMNGGEQHLRFKISPLSFYQVNSLQMEKLYATALQFAELSGSETVWDLYCGTGTISLFLAQNAGQVRGVEIVPAAIRDAKENAKMNGITNAEFFCGKSEEVFPEYMRMQQSTHDEEDGAGRDSAVTEKTVVVLDPPRKGCDRVLLDTLLETGPDRIVYVSCDSATLARDLKILSDGEGKPFRYKVEKVQPVDMFPNSVHVECVVLLERMET
ncbi:MAG: 23S rRNA (uracil(1939)-C(5))-methyltransferase RlmD, partial [Lachnospiraceae bacterium]|nr:23S rRNA (uracil(1939)-C(5))-methyltransferase RlmD [Lachnospiraceae bacterium]